MRAAEQRLARATAAAALVVGATYLLWRATATLDGAPLWLAAPAFAVELVAFVSVALLTWALWRRPAAVDGAAGSGAGGHPGDLQVEIAVRCSDQPVEALRATLLAACPVAPVTVVDLAARPAVAALCAEFGADLVAPDADDPDGVLTAARASTADGLLVLDAGDVVHPRALHRLAPWLREPDVAVVQGEVTWTPGDSGEVGAGGRHELELERRALVPALGARGVAPFTGSGALVRPAALRGLSLPDTSPPMAHALVTTALIGAGWRIVAAEDGPVVAATIAPTFDTSEVKRACAASAARHLLAGPDGAWRARGLRLAGRLAFAALAVRPLSGVRRSVTVAVICAALVAGRLPFEPSWHGILGLWLPWFALSAMGLWMLSAGTLRPGDRLRTSMRSFGASWRGLLSPNGRLDRLDEPHHSRALLTGLLGLKPGGASAVAVAALSVVIAMRAVSDRATHTLAVMPLDRLVPLLGVALWTIAGGLDALRILARRAQQRRATRVVSSLPATLGPAPALVVDLTPLGAGVMADAELPVGAEHRLEVVVPTTSGCVSAVMPVHVRNVRADFSGDRHIGVEFGPVEPYVADALAEYCILQPAMDVLGATSADAGFDSGIDDLRPVIVTNTSPRGPRRLGLRAAALVAVTGAIASTVPPSSAEAANVGAARRVWGSISAEGAPATSAPTVVTAVCADDAGADGRFGTADDAYRSPVTTDLGEAATFGLRLEGTACWWWAAPALGLGSRAGGVDVTAPRVVDLAARSLPTVHLVATDPAASTAGDLAVHDAVWVDADGDRVFGADEAPVRGARVLLLDGAGAAVATTRTGDDGTFELAGLAAGTYRVAVADLPDGLVAGTPTGLGRTFTLEPGVDVDVSVPLRPADRRATAEGAAPPEQAVAAGDDTAGGAAASAAAQVLPVPAPSELRPVPDRRSVVGGLVVILFAGLIGLSVLAGSMAPLRAAPSQRLPVWRQGGAPRPAL